MLDVGVLYVAPFCSKRQKKPVICAGICGGSFELSQRIGCSLAVNLGLAKSQRTVRNSRSPITRLVNLITTPPTAPLTSQARNREEPKGTPKVPVDSQFPNLQKEPSSAAPKAWSSGILYANQAQVDSPFGEGL